jgi:tRNA A-37 threonylcarbamoyl transferase component Bud32
MGERVGQARGASMVMQGTVLGGRYHLLDVIGDGGMARVFRAEDARLGRVVAVKILHRHYLAQPEFVRRFEQEARLAAGLSHPNIVAIYDVDRQGDTYYIVMECVEGGSLKGLIARDAPLPLSLAAAIMRQLGQALDAAHARGVVHRDIKPENILLTPSHDVKVGDFGIARALTSPAQTATGMVMGSVSYFSPEQAQGKPATAESDLYSSGIVLYEMLTGRLPFAAGNPVATAMQHITQEPAPPRAIVPALPPAVDAVALRALAKDPAQRYHSGAAFVQAFDAAATTATGRAARTGTTGRTKAAHAAHAAPPRLTPTAPLTRPPSPPRRRRRVAAVPLAVIALLGGGAAYAAMHRSDIRTLFPSGATGASGPSTPVSGVGSTAPGAASGVAARNTLATPPTPPMPPMPTTPVARVAGGLRGALSARNRPPAAPTGGPVSARVAAQSGPVTASIVTARGYTKVVGGGVIPVGPRDTFTPGALAYAVFRFHLFPPGAAVEAVWTFPNGARSSYFLDRPTAYSWCEQTLGNPGRYTVTAVVNGRVAGSHAFSVAARSPASTPARLVAPDQQTAAQPAIDPHNLVGRM